MRTYYQLLVWLALICALSLIVINELRQHPTIKIAATDTLHADLAHIDLANMFEANGQPTAEFANLVATQPEHEAMPNFEQSASGVGTIAMNVYHTRNADSLWKIAKAHNVDMYTLASVNKLENPHQIKVGQPIKIPAQPGILHTVKADDTLEDIALQYDVSMQSVIEANGIADADSILEGAELFVPNARISQSLHVKLLQPSKFVWPVRGKISDAFGYRMHPVFQTRRLHNGIDIVANHGSPVKAVASGVVRFSGDMGGYGKLVIIDHQNGYETRYAHNSRLKVQRGQMVRQGQVIASVGRTGRVKGVHLHFELRGNGKPIDPMKFLKH